MLTLTPDERALLAAVIAEPTCDVVRGAFADMLQGNAGTVACPDDQCRDGQIYMMRLCKDGVMRNAWGDCDTCSGSCVVSDGREEWAEFIRNQCGEKRAFIASVERFADGWRCHGRNGDRALATALESLLRPVDAPVGVSVVFRRGFPHTVRGNLESLRGRSCVMCDWEGGKRRLELRLCSLCHGVGRVGGVLMAMVGSQPVERVEVTDRAALHANLNGWHWLMDETPNHFGTVESRLPWSVYRLLKSPPAGEWSKACGSEATAKTALSAALLAEARDDAAKAGSVLT